MNTHLLIYNVLPSPKYCCGVGQVRLSARREGMGNTNDLTGQRFGMYTVIEQAESSPGGHRRWTCRCDCGEIRVVFATNLKKGHSTGCGCRRFRDLAGERIGRLTVLERSDRYASRGERKVQLWKCLCDCGAITYKATDTLTNPEESMCSECSQRHAAACARAGAGYVEGTQLSKIQNIPQESKGFTGVRGVYFEAKNRKYRARLKFQGKVYNLGSYSTLEEAAQARRVAEEDIYGNFLAMRKPSTNAETEAAKKL